MAKPTHPDAALALRERRTNNTEPRPVVALRLTPRLVAELDEWAKELNRTSFGRVTRSSLAERILAKALEERAAEHSAVATQAKGPQER